MKKNTWKNRWWILLIISAVLVLLLEIIQISTQPAVYKSIATEEMKAQESKIYPDQLSSSVGYEETDDGLIVIQGDPQLYFYTDNCGVISQVYFYFFKPVEKELHIQVFYPGADGITEINSAKTDCSKGIDFCSVEIPAAEYDYLRIDIDGSPIALDSIGTGTITAGHEYVKPKVHIVRMLIVTILLFAVLSWIVWIDGWNRFGKTIQGGIHKCYEGGKKSIFNALIFPAVIGVFIGLFWIIYGTKITVPQIIFAGFVGLFVASLFTFRKTLKTQPEYLFLILVLCFGFLTCYYMPHTGLNGWDEDNHYYYALKLSYVDSIIVTKQDRLTQDRQIEPVSYDLNGGIQELNNYQDQMNQVFVAEYNTFTYPEAVPELFNGLGLFIGRVFRLPYYLMHFLGRFFGLLTYGIVGFFAIRKLKSGKMIAAIALLIPTEMFIACTYNYDSYLAVFTALGLCYYTAQWQERDSKLTLKDSLIMIGSIAFGCLTKPIYFPLLWILVLLPRDKFPDRRRHIYFICSIVMITGLLAFCYILPRKLANGGTGDLFTDVRGGSEVNSAEQIKYILSHPLEYADILWRFLTNEYFNLSRVGELLTNYAYHGILQNQYLYLILMVIVAVTDKNDYDQPLINQYWTRILTILFSLMTIILSVTAMYVAFTPVGSTQVNGAQFRYMIPAVLPFLLYIGSGKIKNNMDRGWYNGLTLGVAAYIQFACVYNTFIIKYY